MSELDEELQSPGHAEQVSAAPSNAFTTRIHTFMYAVPFFTASTRAASPSVEKSFGPCRALTKAMLRPASAALTHWSA